MLPAAPQRTSLSSKLTQTLVARAGTHWRRLAPINILALVSEHREFDDQQARPRCLAIYSAMCVVLCLYDAES